MFKNETILVTGVMGQLGEVVVRSLLLHHEIKVRALTRSPVTGERLKWLGAEVAIGDLRNRASLDLALRGVNKVFLEINTFDAGVEAEVQQGINMVEAAQNAGVDHIVYSSVASADKKTSVPLFEAKWQMEQYIQEARLPATIIRPVFFMENLYSPRLLSSLQKGRLTLPLAGDRQLQMVSLYDIGRFGVDVLLRREEFLGQVVELAGDELSLNEAMRLLSESLGRTIRYEQLPDDQAERRLGHDFAAMFRWFNKVGFNVDISSLEQKWGIPLIKFRDFVASESVTEHFREMIHNKLVFVREKKQKLPSISL